MGEGGDDGYEQAHSTLVDKIYTVVCEWGSGFLFMITGPHIFYDTCIFLRLITIPALMILFHFRYFYDTIFSDTFPIFVFFYDIYFYDTFYFTNSYL